MIGQTGQRPAILSISALGVLTIVTYGACYYAFGVMIQPISDQMHWSTGSLGLIFSAVLLVNGLGAIPAGRLLDRLGSRPGFAVAAVAGAGAMFVSSFQSSFLLLATAYAGGCGLVGALGYYHVTQAVVARAAPNAPARAIIRLTLFGAFASPIYQPMTGWLVENIGWRGAIRVEACTVAMAFVLAAAIVNRHENLTPEAPCGRARDALGVALRNPQMRAWLLATLIGSAAVDVFLVYQIPIMDRAGLSLGVAALVAGFRGMSELVGRLPLGKVIDRLGARRTLVIAYVIGAIAALLLFAGGSLAMALVLSFLAGSSFGALDSLRGIYTQELVDPCHLGTLLGSQQAVFGFGGAIGPAVAGLLIDATSSYTPAILIVGAGFVIAAWILHFGANHGPATELTGLQSGRAPAEAIPGADSEVAISRQSIAASLPPPRHEGASPTSAT
jgi:predicted MFS family arabinose efflux permease